MKKKDRDIIKENLENLQLIADHGTKEMRKMAMAILTVYYSETKRRKRRKKRGYAQ